MVGYVNNSAIISIMAQAGLFVPCTECTLGIVDKIFSRIGANDDLSSNESTFMVS
jgi:DNA mismatch repair protein MutS